MNDERINNKPMFTAADRLAHRRRTGTAPTFAPPHTVIICYQPALLRYAVKRWRGQKKNGFFGDFYLLRKADGQIGVSGNFGVGSPVTAVLLEDFVAYGIRQFISIGLAGGLQESLTAGSRVIANRAIRDEGTSRHYLPPSHDAAPSDRLTQQLRQALDERSAPYAVGATWTTDAPYCETFRDAAQHREEGVLTVEMETAALFAVAQHLQVNAAAALVIGDSMQNGRWQIEFDVRRTQKSLQTLLDTAIHMLQT